MTLLKLPLGLAGTFLLLSAFTLNGCEEKAPPNTQQTNSANGTCFGRNEAECVAPCQKVESIRAQATDYDFMECSGNEAGGSTVITCAVPPDRSELRVFPTTLIPQGWEEVGCNSGFCGLDAGFDVTDWVGANPVGNGAMAESTSASPCCTRADCPSDDPDLVCFLGHCTNEPPGPCEEGTCPEGEGCAQNVQQHCEGCSNDSACVQPSVCELINGEACTLGTVQTDAQAMDPVDSSLIDAGALCTTPADPVDPGGPYVGQFGCHATSYAPTDCLDLFGLGTPDCPGSGRDASLPEDLPCGSCDDTGYVCSIGVHAQCDCDGDGPSASFSDPNYWDQWGCMCVNGTWQCWILNVSGASCNGCIPQDDAGTSLP